MPGVSPRLKSSEGHVKPGPQELCLWISFSWETTGRCQMVATPTKELRRHSAQVVAIHVPVTWAKVHLMDHTPLQASSRRLGGSGE